MVNLSAVFIPWHLGAPWQGSLSIRGRSNEEKMNHDLDIVRNNY